jgi:hypothetical protein
MTDSLTPLAKTPFSSTVEALEELMSHSSRVFLMGAGCSSCAGLPLTLTLTKEVLETAFLRDTTKEILSSLTKQFEGSTSATIEDYMSELVDLLAIAERRKQRCAICSTVNLGDKTYQVNELHEALDQIKEAIAKCIESKTIEISTHWQFIKAIHRTLRSGKTGNVKPVDYLVLNYDTLIEDALALEKLPYTDGFLGGVTGWWNEFSFSAENLSARVLKIHGSIDWCELNDDTMPCRIRSTLTLPTGSKKRVLIWPAATKYRETQRDPYAQIAGIMRRILGPSHASEVILTICGYRFGDSHINLELDRALHESGKVLTCLVFTGQNEPEGQLKAWFEDPKITDQVRIHAKRGFFHGSNVARSGEDLPWWKFENLTRLLGGERW